MKAIYFLGTLLVMTVFISCDNKSNEQKDAKDDLVGVWNLQSITGGFAGTGYPANFTDVEFKSNNTYRINNQDEAKGEGSYSLTTVDDQLMLQMTPNDTTKIGFEEHEKTVVYDGDKLILSDPCCDLFQYEFTKAIN